MTLYLSRTIISSPSRLFFHKTCKPDDTGLAVASYAVHAAHFWRIWFSQNRLHSMFCLFLVSELQFASTRDSCAVPHRDQFRRQSSIKEPTQPGHFEVRKSLSQVRSPRVPDARRARLSSMIWPTYISPIAQAAWWKVKKLINDGKVMYLRHYQSKTVKIFFPMYYRQWWIKMIKTIGRAERGRWIVKSFDMARPGVAPPLTRHWFVHHCIMFDEPFTRDAPLSTYTWSVPGRFWRCRKLNGKSDSRQTGLVKQRPSGRALAAAH